MERRKFLSQVGFSVAAVCTGCLAACSKSGSSATPNNTPVNFTVDLSSNLENIGDSVVKNGVIIVRLADGNTADSFTAVQVACTHEGTPIAYHNNEHIFICPLHGSEFSNSGAVLQGPATSNLKKYNVAIANGIMTITS